VFTTYFLGHLLSYENIETLEIREYIPGRLEQAIAEGHVDFGITYAPIPRAGVEFIEVTRIRMGVFGTSELKKKYGGFAQIPFVVPVELIEGTPSKVVGLDGWPDHMFEREVKFRVTLMESAFELCRESRAAAYLPEFIVGLHNKKVKPEFQLKEIPSPIPSKERLQSVFIVRRQHESETKLFRNIAKSLRALS
jgi:DNA-binding transcriptional LysR family regulator